MYVLDTTTLRWRPRPQSRTHTHTCSHTLFFQVSLPQRPLLLEFESSMKYLYQRNQTRARQHGHLNRNHGSVAWDQLLVPVTSAQEKELKAAALEAAVKRRGRRGGKPRGGGGGAKPDEDEAVEDVEVAELEIFVYIRDSSSRPFMAVHRGDEHEVVKNVAYLLGQEQVLGELAATTVGVAPIAEGDCAVGMARITVRNSRNKSNADVWEGEVRACCRCLFVCVCACVRARCAMPACAKASKSTSLPSPLLVADVAACLPSLLTGGRAIW